MKKIIFLVTFIMLFTVGCSNIKTDNIENIINKKIKFNYSNKVYNIYHRGYQYYLPKKMSVDNINDTNEIIKSDKYTYYLYLDLISVLENTEIELKEEDNLYKALKFNYRDLNGYLKIKKLNQNYLVEIMYNYAKIEVIVEEDDLNEVVNNSITILSTIKYKKDIIANLMEENLLNYKDESLNLFDKNNNKDNFIKYEEQYDSYEESIPDYDKVN